MLNAFSGNGLTPLTFGLVQGFISKVFLIAASSQYILLSDLLNTAFTFVPSGLVVPLDVLTIPTPLYSLGTPPTSYAYVCKSSKPFLTLGCKKFAPPRSPPTKSPEPTVVLIRFVPISPGVANGSNGALNASCAIPIANPTLDASLATPNALLDAQAALSPVLNTGIPNAIFNGSTILAVIIPQKLPRSIASRLALLRLRLSFRNCICSGLLALAKNSASCS